MGEEDLVGGVQGLDLKLALTQGDDAEDPSYFRRGKGPLAAGFGEMEDEFSAELVLVFDGLQVEGGSLLLQADQ